MNGWPIEPLVLPNALRDSILSKECVVFIGSGISRECYADWPTLINTLCNRCGVPQQLTRDSSALDLQVAADRARNANTSIYYNVLGEVFGQPINRANVLYPILLSLPFRSYITTNYDPTLSFFASLRSDCTLPPMAYPNLDRAHINNRSIYYIHGYVSEDTCRASPPIILTKSDFDDAYEYGSPLVAFLQQTFYHDPICFIGCGLNEPELNRLFDCVKKHHIYRHKLAADRMEPPSHPPRRFQLLAKPVIKTNEAFDMRKSSDEMNRLEDKFKDLGIVTVWYVAMDDSHTVLRKAFDSLRPRRDTTPKFAFGSKEPPIGP